MTDPVHPLAPSEVESQVRSDLGEGLLHRVAEMADATIETIDGPQDQTISTADAQAVLKGHGMNRVAALVLDRVLNVLSPDHGEKAMIADYVRAVVEAHSLALFLDEQTLAVANHVIGESFRLEKK